MLQAALNALLKTHFLETTYKPPLENTDRFENTA